MSDLYRPASDSSDLQQCRNIVSYDTNGSVYALASTNSCYGQ